MQPCMIIPLEKTLQKPWEECRLGSLDITAITQFEPSAGRLEVLFGSKVNFFISAYLSILPRVPKWILLYYKEGMISEVVTDLYYFKQRNVIYKPCFIWAWQEVH